MDLREMKIKTPTQYRTIICFQLPKSDDLINCIDYLFVKKRSIN